MTLTINITCSKVNYMNYNSYTSIGDRLKDRISRLSPKSEYRLFLALIIISLLYVVVYPGAIIFTLYFIYKAIVAHYFTTNAFNNLKNKISKNTKDCNDLNEHIESLKMTFSNFKQSDYGDAEYSDHSKWKYKRPNLRFDTQDENTYRCSQSVCRNASQQPFKYVMKYFNIESNEKTLEQFEETLNNYVAAEQGKELLVKQRDEIIQGISSDIPWYILKFNKEKLYSRLGFYRIDFSQMYFPKYTFQYVSSGGNSAMHCDVIFDINNLNKFIEYLGGIIKFRKSIAGQRALMTSKLRECIKERDHYTCKICKNSIKKEPNLLLEIDHIKPLAKGGVTEEKNLQTLCWRCNRSKGSKILN